MKPFWAIFGGFVVFFGTFTAGAAFAIAILAAESHQPVSSNDVAEIWTAQPRRVNLSTQQLERLPAKSNSAEVHVAKPGPVAEADHASESVDMTVTTALPPEESERRKRLNQLSAAHIQWCSDKYRSYRPAGNIYTAYSGRKRPCISQYWEKLMAAIERPSDMDSDAESHAEVATDQAVALLQHASGSTERGTRSSPHTEDCLSRYRSYRPEDNTFQPYGGDQRRQCR